MITSPTGLGIRNDPAGSGAYGAPRGDTSHKGTDFKCVPGSDVYAPISGQVVRLAYPYVGDLKWSGCLLVSDQMRIKLFYMSLSHTLRQNLRMDGPYIAPIIQGSVIGTAQDITKKYPDQEMTPHVHMEIKISKQEWVLVDPQHYIK